MEFRARDAVWWPMWHQHRRDEVPLWQPTGVNFSPAHLPPFPHYEGPLLGEPRGIGRRVALRRAVDHIRDAAWRGLEAHSGSHYAPQSPGENLYPPQETDNVFPDWEDRILTTHVEGIFYGTQSGEYARLPTYTMADFLAEDGPNWWLLERELPNRYSICAEGDRQTQLCLRYLVRFRDSWAARLLPAPTCVSMTTRHTYGPARDLPMLASHVSRQINRHIPLLDEAHQRRHFQGAGVPELLHEIVPRWGNIGDYPDSRYIGIRNAAHLLTDLNAELRWNDEIGQRFQPRPLDPLDDRIWQDERVQRVEHELLTGGWTHAAMRGSYRIAIQSDNWMGLSPGEEALFRMADAIFWPRILQALTGTERGDFARIWALEDHQRLVWHPITAALRRLRSELTLHWNPRLSVRNPVEDIPGIIYLNEDHRPNHRRNPIRVDNVPNDERWGWNRWNQWGSRNPHGA